MLYVALGWVLCRGGGGDGYEEGVGGTPTICRKSLI